jgi:gliding motility-associated lipoprotein GldD
MKKRSWVFIVLFQMLIAACNSDYPYRPRGYFKIDLPQKSYQKFEHSGFPYTFEYPSYARIIQDTAFFEQRPENPYWINVDFPQFGSRIHLSYKEVGKNNYDSLVADAFTLSYKQHTYKASAIEPEPFTTPNGSSGVYFSLRGNTATSNQFFISDSTKHFLRGALYFSATPNEDSLRPVNDFLRKDVEHLINTVQWR